MATQEGTPPPTQPLTPGADPLTPYTLFRRGGYSSRIKPAIQLQGDQYLNLLRLYLEAAREYHGGIYNHTLHRIPAYVRFIDDWCTLGYASYDLGLNAAAGLVHSKQVRLVDERVKEQMVKVLLEQGIHYGDSRAVLAVARRAHIMVELNPGPIPSQSGAENIPEVVWCDEIMKNAMAKAPAAMWYLLSGGHRTAAILAARALAAQELEDADNAVKKVVADAVGFELVLDEDEVMRLLRRAYAGAEEDEAEVAETAAPKKKKKKKAAADAAPEAAYASLASAQRAYNEAVANKRKWQLVTKTYLGNWLVKFIDLDVLGSLPPGIWHDVMDALAMNETMPQLAEGKDERFANAIYAFIQSRLSLDPAFRLEQLRLWQNNGSDPKWGEVIRNWDPLFASIYGLLNCMGVHGRASTLFVLANVRKVYQNGFALIAEYCYQSHRVVSYVIAGVTKPPFIGRDVVHERFWQISSEAFKFAFGTTTDLPYFFNVDASGTETWATYTTKFLALIDEALKDPLGTFVFSAEQRKRLGEMFGLWKPVERQPDPREDARIPPYSFVNAHTADFYDRAGFLMPIACNDAINYLAALANRQQHAFFELACAFNPAYRLGIKDNAVPRDPGLALLRSLFQSPYFSGDAREDKERRALFTSRFLFFWLIRGTTVFAKLEREVAGREVGETSWVIVAGTVAGFVKDTQRWVLNSTKAAELRAKSYRPPTAFKRVPAALDMTPDALNMLSEAVLSEVHEDPDAFVVNHYRGVEKFRRAIAHWPRLAELIPKDSEKKNQRRIFGRIFTCVAFELSRYRPGGRILELLEDTVFGEVIGEMLLILNASTQQTAPAKAGSSTPRDVFQVFIPFGGAIGVDVRCAAWFIDSLDLDADELAGVTGTAREAEIRALLTKLYGVSWARRGDDDSDDEMASAVEPIDSFWLEVLIYVRDVAEYLCLKHDFRAAAFARLELDYGTENAERIEQAAQRKEERARAKEAAEEKARAAAKGKAKGKGKEKEKATRRRKRDEPVSDHTSDNDADEFLPPPKPSSIFFPWHRSMAGGHYSKAFNAKRPYFIDDEVPDSFPRLHAITLPWETQRVKDKVRTKAAAKVAAGANRLKAPAAGELSDGEELVADALRRTSRSVAAPLSVHLTLALEAEAQLEAKRKAGAAGPSAGGRKAVQREAEEEEVEKVETEDGGGGEEAEAAEGGVPSGQKGKERAVDGPVIEEGMRLSEDGGGGSRDGGEEEEVPGASADEAEVDALADAEPLPADPLRDALKDGGGTDDAFSLLFGIPAPAPTAQSEDVYDILNQSLVGEEEFLKMAEGGAQKQRKRGASQVSTASLSPSSQRRTAPKRPKPDDPRESDADDSGPESRTPLLKPLKSTAKPAPAAAGSRLGAAGPSTFGARVTRANARGGANMMGGTKKKATQQGPEEYDDYR